MSDTHAPAFTINTLPAKCSNIECPNETHQGMFAFAQFAHGNVVGGHRSITLHLCMPCAQALHESVIV